MNLLDSNPKMAELKVLLMLQQIIENFNRQGIQFYISNPIGPVRDAIKNSALDRYLCSESMFATIHDAITYIDEGVNVHPDDALQTDSK